MSYANTTTITNFVIVGFPGLSPKYYGTVSAVFLLTYLFIFAGNIFILSVIGFERSFHKPTYLIYSHLALNDLLIGTMILPLIISRYWWGNQIVSFGACFAQMYFVHSLEATNSLLLLVMALDRFTAICLPLRYPALITNVRISTACGLSWIVTFLRMLILLFHSLSLSYCDSNIIVQCYCNHISIVTLACNEELKISKVLALSFAMFGLVLPLAFILFSYVSVLTVTLRIRDKNRQYKALSTCMPQMLITCLYYLPRCLVYIMTFVGVTLSVDLHISVVLLYSLFPPAANPIIYCMKMKAVKDYVRNRLHAVKVGSAE